MDTRYGRRGSVSKKKNNKKRKRNKKPVKQKDRMFFTKNNDTQSTLKKLDFWIIILSFLAMLFKWFLVFWDFFSRIEISHYLLKLI